MSSTIADIGEHALIDRIRARAGPSPAWIALGIGDDAALIAPDRGALVALSTDTLVEDVHFRRAWTSPEAIGHKALAVSLSDLAAMGATPRAALLSVAVPAAWPLDDFDAFVDGFVTLGERTGTPLVGGNVTRSPGPFVVDVTVTGSVHPRRTLRRSTGRPGDELYLTGSVGGAAAGLARLAAGLDPSALDEDGKDCVWRYERPEPRLRCGIVAARSRTVQTGMDLSDGLADAVARLATASRTGAILDADAVPVHPGARSWWMSRGEDAIAQAVRGGEDYEIVFAVSPKRRRAFLAAVAQWRGVPATRIGRLVAEAGTWLLRETRLEPLPTGFVHF